MTWHDGRFMRHSRFRYWFHDTSLRLMTPGMQRTFFRTREAVDQYTHADLQHEDVRQELMHHMSSATDPYTLTHAIKETYICAKRDLHMR